MGFLVVDLFKYHIGLNRSIEDDGIQAWSDIIHDLVGDPVISLAQSGMEMIQSELVITQINKYVAIDKLQYVIYFL